MDEYNRILEELATDVIARVVIKNNYGKPINKIYELIQLEYTKHTSSTWFNGDIVLVYPSVVETKSKKYYETIHGVYIGMNASYINYHALLINVTNGCKYVLERPLRFELHEDVPKSITDLEKQEKTTGVDIPLRRVSKSLRYARK